MNQTSGTKTQLYHPAHPDKDLASVILAKAGYPEIIALDAGFHRHDGWRPYLKQHIRFSLAKLVTVNLLPAKLTTAPLVTAQLITFL